ncbi:protease HtpX [Halioxenophilus sp. WMMB6]|uniref:protease HtpX n=1 Tax=Halioxenophilus sp. WMMB6 TaxID=3073815 RepID=UPI00295E5FEF|nr:protease HtpX [Halioxenophilus sp. WMMB6]
MMRIGLFLLTNIAVLVVASITLNLLGVGHYLEANGTGLNLTSLLIFCAVFGFSGALISLFLSKTIAKFSTRTRLIESPRSADERWLIETVQDLANRADIKMPEVGIFPSPASNAFATGWNKNGALVAVSEGLLHRFQKDEIRAVLAHEIGHVANGDMVTLALIQGVVNTFVMFFARIIGYAVDRAVFKTERGHGLGFYAVTIVAEIVLGILASMVVMAFSRFREYRADNAGAKLAGKQSMINALARLQAETQAKVPSDLPDTMYAFGISGGFKERFTSLLSSHPPLADRIAALQRSDY